MADDPRIPSLMAREAAAGAGPATWSESASPAAMPISGPLAGLVVVALVLFVALALREVASLLVPVLFGLFIALVASPLVGALERRGARHGVALASAILVVLAVVIATFAIVAFSVGQLVVQIPKYEDRLAGLLSDLRDALAGFGIQADQEAITSVISPSAIVGFVRPLASAASSAATALFVLAFTLVFALAGAPGMRARAEAAFGAGPLLLVGVERFGGDLRRYLVVRAKLGLFAAVLTFVLLLVLGVPLPALWAFLVFASSFIPNIGFILALIPPTILALLEGGIGPAVAVVVGYTLINFAQDQFLQPTIMGTELNLSALVVFLSVIGWAWILGAAGALLAVPLTVGLVLILEAYPATRGLATLMRGRVDAPAVSTPAADESAS